MDPQDETRPLLARRESQQPQTLSGASQTTFSRIWERYDSLPTVVRVTPIIFLSSLADGLPQLTIVEIMKSVLCAVWYLKNSPDGLPEDGPIPDEKCQTPGPVAWFSAFMVIQALLTALGAFLMSSAIAQFGTRVGRKPILLLIVLGQFVAMASFVSALFMPSDIGALVLLGVWLVTSSFFSVSPVIFTCNLMVVDNTDPSVRTAALSFTMGALAAGGIPSFALGGVIYRATGPRVLCLITLGTFAFTFLLASSGFVRETFGGNKLVAARHERRERQRNARERSLERWTTEAGDSTRGVRRVFRKMFEAVQAVLEPVMRLKPNTQENGKLNFRLTFLALAYFFVALGTGYLGQALVSYMTVVTHFDPTQSGVIMTFISIFQTAGLALVFPVLSKQGRALYATINSRKNRGKQQSNGQADGAVAEEQPISSTVDNEDTLDNDTSEISVAHFDVHLLRWCCIVFIVLLLGAGYARTNAHLIGLASLLLLCSGSHPTMQSVAAASVSPILAGEAIAGIEMVGYIARFASPVVIGTLQSKTILTMPMVAFFTMAAFVLVGTILTLLIRDEDRYIPPTGSPSTPQEVDSEEEQ